MPSNKMTIRNKDKAAIALQCKLNEKLKAALLFIPYLSIQSDVFQELLNAYDIAST